MSVFKVGSNKSSQNNFPSVRPTLDLDFANSKTLDPRITFTRASGGSYVGADGLIKYAGVNEPRFDHDPVTGESLGFLVEESRSNIKSYSILFDSGVSASLYGNWAYASILSYTAAITPDGTLTANRFRPTSPTATLMQRFSATAGVTYTISMYCKLDPESPSNNLIQYFGFEVAWSNNGSTLTSHVSSPSIGAQLTNEWKRFSFSYTLPAGAISMEMGPSNCNSGGGDPNYSVLAWGWQIEAGAFPTSYIPTEASTRTRAADNASITGKNFSSWFNPSVGTFFTDSTNDNLTSNIARSAYDTTNTVAFSLGSGSGRVYTPILGYLSNNTIICFLFSFNGGGTEFGPNLQNTLSNTADVSRVCVYTDILNNLYAISTAGQINVIGRPLDVSRTGQLAYTLAQSMVIGYNSNYYGNYIGRIKRITYYPKRLTNQQLQVLTR